MTNEQIVEQIRNGFSVTDNMEQLYLANLPLIRQIIQPYTIYEDETDLLQEAYFGLSEAVMHYESSENVKFMTYARFWIIQQVKRYIEDFGAVLRIPAHVHAKINRYKKAVQEYQQIYGAVPTDKQIANYTNMSAKEIRDIQLCAAGIQSIDAPIKDNEDISLSDVLQADYSLENDTIDKIYDDYQRNGLWGIVERYTDEQQQNIIRQYFRNGKSISQIASESGEKIQTVRTQKNNALRKLRTGKVGRELREKFEILNAGVYRTGVKSFKEHNCTSIVEYVAIRRMELEKAHQKVVNQTV